MANPSHSLRRRRFHLSARLSFRHSRANPPLAPEVSSDFRTTFFSPISDFFAGILNLPGGLPVYSGWRAVALPLLSSARARPPLSFAMLFLTGSYRQPPTSTASGHKVTSSFFTIFFFSIFLIFLKMKCCPEAYKMLSNFLDHFEFP